jgi:hypothetical protein
MDGKERAISRLRPHGGYSPLESLLLALPLTRALLVVGVDARLAHPVPADALHCVRKAEQVPGAEPAPAAVLGVPARLVPTQERQPAVNLLVAAVEVADVLDS